MTILTNPEWFAFTPARHQTIICHTDFESYKEFGLKYHTQWSDQSQRREFLCVEERTEITQAIRNALAKDNSHLIRDVKIPRLFTEEREAMELHPFGCFPCIPSGIMGVPNNMWSPAETDSGRAVKLVFNASVSGSTSAKDMALRAAYCRGLVEELKIANVRVELWMMCEGDWYDRCEIMAITHVLKSNESVDTQTLQECFSGGCVYRALFLCAQPRSHSVGWCEQSFQDKMWELMGFDREDCIMLNSIPTMTSDKAVEFLKTELARLGVVE